MKEAKTIIVTVRATAPGFCFGRRRVGEQFDMAVPLDAEGKPVLPSWVALAPAMPKVEASTNRKKSDKITLAEGGKQTGADLV